MNKKTIASIITMIFIFFVGSGFASDDERCEMHFPDTWSEVSPESVGMDSGKITSFLSSVRSIGKNMDAVVIRNGQIVGETGSMHSNRDWSSALKPWLSLLTVLMVQDGTIGSLDEPVNYPGLQDKDRGITWRHLMLMTSGYANTESPGTKFAYNDRAISLFIASLRWKLRTDLTKAIKNYLPELNFHSPAIMGGNGRSSASLSDYAKLLQLLMNKGSWDNKPLIKEELIEDAFSKIATESMSSSSNSKGGYLNIPYIGGGSNQTRSTGHGPGEYVFNGWQNVFGRFGMPTDFWQANGNWGRVVAGFSSSLRLIVIVRIEGYYPEPEGSATAGITLKYLSQLNDAVKVQCTNPLGYKEPEPEPEPPVIIPIITSLLLSI
ncbi:MAG: hypothetical protein ABFQ53_00325 [Patescibacteria group bacterium]